MAFPDTSLASQFTDGESLNAAKLDARITAQLNILATRLIGRVIDSGTVSITPSAANTPTKVTVTFAKTFSSVPVVVATFNGTVPGTVVTGVSATNVTTTTVDIYVTRTNTTSTSVSWIAILSP